MRMGRLIARFPFERTAISPPGPEQHGSMAGQMPGNCRDDQQGPGFSIARGWPAGCYPEQATKERRRWRQVGRNPLSTASPVVLNATVERRFQ